MGCKASLQGPGIHLPAKTWIPLKPENALSRRNRGNGLGDPGAQSSEMGTSAGRTLSAQGQRGGEAGSPPQALRSSAAPSAQAQGGQVGDCTSLTSVPWG